MTSDDPRRRNPADDDFRAPPLAGLIIYQTKLDPTADEDTRAAVLDHIAGLGVTAVEFIACNKPVVADGQYVPAHISLERAFGGAAALRQVVAEAHRRGLAVILGVAYQLRETVIASAPDIDSGDVREHIVREALRWLRDTHVDGLRHDMAPYTDLVNASGLDRSAGWQLIREMNRAIRDEYGDVVLIALEAHGYPQVTSLDESGALFHTQWDTLFVHPIREAINGLQPMADVRDAIGSSFGDTFSRVIYTEADELTGRDADKTVDPMDWESAKRVTLGIGLVLTSPGIPMLLQGQEVLQGGTLCERSWRETAEQPGIADLVRQLVRLRRNWYDTTRGLSGHGLDVFVCDEDSKVVAWRRWADGGPGDDVVIVANFSPTAFPVYRLGMPDDGLWRARFSSDDSSYSPMFSGHPTSDVEAEAWPKDGQPASADVSVGPYSLVVYSQDR
jgi:1,4-alpha-glucan branching enzyme